MKNTILGDSRDKNVDRVSTLTEDFPAYPFHFVMFLFLEHQVWKVGLIFETECVQCVPYSERKGRLWRFFKIILYVYIIFYVSYQQIDTGNEVDFYVALWMLIELIRTALVHCSIALTSGGFLSPPTPVIGRSVVRRGCKFPRVLPLSGKARRTQRDTVAPVLTELQAPWGEGPSAPRSTAPFYFFFFYVFSGGSSSPSFSLLIITNQAPRGWGCQPSWGTVVPSAAAAA